MSNVSLAIGGRSFTVACAEGEEEHVAELGRTIDAKLASMGEMSGQSEPRMLLFAALLLADEVHDLKANGDGAGEARSPFAGEGTAERLAAIASRLENLAARLEA